ncbi:MAG TPA: universal stress protein [Candidatus Binataceae bacterium]|nr:universal stress protein [Candidatus Binataceae bacterium]
MSYKKILCPIDHEENSRAAFETAARLARESHGTLYLIHVVPLPTSIVGESILSNDRERAHRGLQRLAAQLPATLGRVIVVRFGNPAREITAVARRIGADLIVVGTHGRTMMARFFQGSTAEKVVADAPCPVLALPPDTVVEALDTASQAA